MSLPGNHLTMLDAESAGDPSIQIIVQTLCKGAAVHGARSAAKVSIESGDFGDIISRLWPNWVSNPDQVPANLDDYCAVQLAIALEKTGDSAAALAVLKSHKPKGTDVVGVLAARPKRRWWLTGNAEDLDDGRKRYQEAYINGIGGGVALALGALSSTLLRRSASPSVGNSPYPIFKDGV